MHIERLDLSDVAGIHACHAAFAAAQRVDEPQEPLMGERIFRAWFTVGFSGEPREVWLIRDREQGTVAGWYRLVTWIGLVPEELIEQMAALYAALSDAPHDPDVEPEKWDAQRVRERVNGLREHFGAREYSVAARHVATGEMAALTQVSIDPPDPGWGFQLITAVTAAHRGHRLGLLVKAAMLEWLATAEPQLERITTWNAEDNKYMIAINEALGYQPFGRPVLSFEVPAADVPGAQS